MWCWRIFICKCRRLIDRLVEEYSESIDGNKMNHNDYKNLCNSCTLYIASFALLFFCIIFIIIIGISSVFIYFHWHLKMSNPDTETTIYQTYKGEISNKLK